MPAVNFDDAGTNFDEPTVTFDGDSTIPQTQFTAFPTDDRLLGLGLGLGLGLSSDGDFPF